MHGIISIDTDFAREMTPTHNEYDSTAFEAAYTYTGNDLGAVWSESKTDFRLWAPTAADVQLKLYASGTAGTDDLLQSIPMQSAENGTWKVSIPGNLHGVYYTYLVSVDGRFCEACDPYARTTGVNGKRAMVIDLSSTDPDSWTEDRNPHAGRSAADAVIYELHIRDLSSNHHAGIVHRGKYLGLTEQNTHTRSGMPTGLSHIVGLGITHLHLLPMYDYGSVDESSTKAQFNWGYDPVNYNVPEGSYATDPFHGEVRIREMKQMIQALHRNGISVVMDVVYNHVYHTAEFCMNQIVPYYFSRFNEKGHLANSSCCGNDTASERSMVRKYIVDSVNYWADEYHIDGFRFDLVGLIDTQTIREITESVHRKHPDVLFYGEGWDMASGVTKPNTPMTIQANSAMVPGFAFFNDRIRDAVRGSVFDFHATGFVTGNTDCKASIKACFLGDPGWTSDPQQVINYVSCHDNHTLNDRIATAMPHLTREELLRRNLLAGSINLLSQGIPFLQAGEELLRSKPGRNGEFVHNSYRSSDRVNSIKWEHLNDTLTQTALQYYRGLIAIRRSHKLFRMTSRQQILAHIHEFPTASPLTAAFRLENPSEHIIVAFNASEQALPLALPEGAWSVLADAQRASSVPFQTIHGNAVVAPLSALVLLQEQ